MEHLNQATSALAESSKKIDGVVDKAGADDGLSKEAADDLQKAIARRAQDDSGRDAGDERGDPWQGDACDLLTNQQLANDLEALISNLRRHGVLFYHDSAAKVHQGSRPATMRTRSLPQSGATMTTLFTVNLLRVLFVTFCVTIGAIVSAELQGNAIPGLLLGAALGLSIVLIDRLLKGFSLRVFSSATFGLLLGLAFRESSDRLRRFALSKRHSAMGGAARGLLQFRLTSA